jgi:hypothetical protein
MASAFSNQTFWGKTASRVFHQLRKRLANFPLAPAKKTLENLTFPSNASCFAVRPQPNLLHA